MNETIAKEIQAEQERGRAKYGSGPNDLALDDAGQPHQWFAYIDSHNIYANNQLRDTQARRKHLIQVAGLAVSAVEAMDREQARNEAKRHASINDSVAEAESRRHLQTSNQSQDTPTTSTRHHTMKDQSATEHFARRQAMQREREYNQTHGTKDAKADDGDCSSAKAKEHPLSTIVRLEARQSLLAENLQAVVGMSDNRAQQVESLTVRVHELARERCDIAFAVGTALETLCKAPVIHSGGDAGAIAALTKQVVRRVDAVKATADGILGVIEKHCVTPQAIRMYAERQDPVNLVYLANIIEAIVIGLTAIKRIAGGNGEGAPVFPNSEKGLSHWLEALHANAAAGEASRLTGGETLYWCPQCKRHIHPENLITGMGDDGLAEFFHPHDGEYSAKVEVRRRFSGPKPVDFWAWMMDAVTRLQVAGMDGDSVRGYNFLAAFQRGETPESVVEDITHTKAFRAEVDAELAGQGAEAEYYGQ